MRLLRLCCLLLERGLPAARAFLPALPAALALALAALTLAAFPDVALADGFEGEGFGGFGGFGGEGFEGGEGEEGFGSLAMMALFVNAAYIPYKWLRAQVPGLNFPWALQVHCAAGAAALLLGTLHALTVDRGNLLLWLGLALMAYETFAGLVLRARGVDRSVRRAAYLLHAQRAGFYLMLAALFLGHAVVGD